MTKQYPLIHLNGFVYAVDEDKKKDHSKGSWVYESNNTVPIYQFSYDMEDYPLQRVIMTNDPSIGLPLLPAIAEPISYKGFNEVWAGMIAEVRNPLTRMQMMQFTEKVKAIWNGGYKAAKAKKYSEEDMLEAVVFGQQQSLLGKAITSTDTTKEKFDKFLQSLNPLPITVEVEIADYSEFLENLPPERKLTSALVGRNGTPTTDMAGFVNVLKWIYE